MFDEQKAEAEARMIVQQQAQTLPAYRDARWVATPDHTIELRKGGLTQVCLTYHRGLRQWSAHSVAKEHVCKFETAGDAWAALLSALRKDDNDALRDRWHAMDPRDGRKGSQREAVIDDRVVFLSVRETAGGPYYVASMNGTPLHDGSKIILFDYEGDAQMALDNEIFLRRGK